MPHSRTQSLSYTRSTEHDKGSRSKRMGCAAFAATADQNLASEREQNAKCVPMSCLCAYSGYFSHKTSACVILAMLT